MDPGPTVLHQHVDTADTCRVEQEQECPDNTECSKDRQEIKEQATRKVWGVRGDNSPQPPHKCNKGVDHTHGVIA